MNAPPGSPSTSVAHSHIPSGGGLCPASAATSTSSAGSVRPVPARPPDDAGVAWPGRASSAVAVMIILLEWCGRRGAMPGFPGPRSRRDGAGRGEPQPARPGRREPQSMEAHLLPLVKSAPAAPDPICPAITQPRDLTPRAETGVDAAGPGRQASRTCPRHHDPAPAPQVTGPRRRPLSGIPSESCMAPELTVGAAARTGPRPEPGAVMPCHSRQLTRHPASAGQGRPTCAFQAPRLFLCRSPEGRHR